MKKIKIGIDGNAGSGKTVLSKKLSSKFNLIHFETGLLYRAITHICLEKNISFNDESTIIKNISSLNVLIHNLEVVVKLNDTILSNSILKENIEIEKNVATFASQKNVRLEIQKNIIALSKNEERIIIEGRETHKIIPDLDFFIFLTANVDVRAKRRAEQYSREKVEEQNRIENRDKIDNVKLRYKNKNFIFVDNTSLSLEKTFNLITNKLHL